MRSRPASARHGRLDVLMNNAGVGPISLLDELRVEEWDGMIDINFRGVLYGIADALPVFREQRCGHVVNVVSTAGLRIVPSQAIYAATKNAVRRLSRGLRQEAGPDLRVTMVSPGFAATEFVDSITSPAVPQIAATSAKLAIPPEPTGVDVGDIVVRPTAQA